MKALRSKSPARRSAAREPDNTLPECFKAWFRARRWKVRPHQLALLQQVSERRATLLIAPTGAGKTLAGFLPTLVSLSAGRKRRDGAGLHTLYISPLKALAVDIARNLEAPIAEMDLGIKVETRTGDTSSAKRRRQRTRPPDILLTTPEQLELLLSYEDWPYIFADLDTIILDELHALVGTKRGDLLALGLARLASLPRPPVAIGLSATVARPTELRGYLVPQRKPDERIALADLIKVAEGAPPDIRILETEEEIPWAGHTTRYAVAELYREIQANRLTLLFVNTRSQAELLFQELWRINETGLPIALHHGSLDAQRRRKVEAAMAAGTLKAVVCTSTLDLGIDWGDVDLVINVGAPKGASRLIQRIGRANHRLDEPSRALLVPSNRFEVLECRAAFDAAMAGSQDVVLNRTGGLDVLAQHVMAVAAAGPFAPDAVYEQVQAALPYATLTRSEFDQVLDFVSTGGYALRNYERYAKLRREPDNRLRLSHPRLADQLRANIGTIIDSPLLKVRLVRPTSLRARSSAGEPVSPRGGRALGDIDEWFIAELTPGDTFAFAGEVLRLEGFGENEVYASRTKARDPKIPAYGGGKFPLSTHLAARVRAMLADRESWHRLPAPVEQWLRLQDEGSRVPAADEVLVEAFPRAGRHFLAAYPFEGRLAHQTLGMLLTRRLKRAGAHPLGFVANDYGIVTWTAKSVSELVETGRLSLGELFDQDMLGDDLDAWLAESTLMKRTFRICAIIAGLVDKRHMGRVKTARQQTVSANLIYDVLRRHDPGHILLEAAWRDAATGLLDIARLGQFLARIKDRICYQSLPYASPLAIPLLLEIGREPVSQVHREDMLREAAQAMLAELHQGHA
ncbi:MAG: hypothetical protein RLZ98_63 [Pseudomonadota bacterium]|jgi:ATP-dependent Lhr-like helicase